MISDVALLTTDERLSLIGVKIERAKKHIVDLKREIDSFLSTNPYGIVEKIDSKLRQPSYEISSVTPVPGIIAAITGDAIHNLRSALDHLTYQLLLVCLNANASDKELTFPIKNTMTEYKSILNGITQRRTLRQDAIDGLQNCEAYKGGKGHQIWVLNRLNNIDKHRVIITVGSAIRSVNLLRHHMNILDESGVPAPPLLKASFPDLMAFFRPANNMCPLKIGDVLMVGVKMDMKVDFRFEIALNEPGVVEGKPLIETIQHFADLVSSTVLCFRPCLS